MSEKIASELDFIRGITTRALDAHDEIMDGLTRTQRTPRLEREMRDQRQRLTTLVQCAVDAISALPKPGDLP